MFGSIWRPSKERWTTLERVNDQTGFKLASSVGGAVTGNRADIVICFPYDVMVLTDAGALPIGKIVDSELDVRVAGWDGTRLIWQTIEAYEKNPADELVEIEIDDQTLRCTIDHPVLVEGRGWVRAEDIREGDVIWTVSEHDLRDLRQGNPT